MADPGILLAVKNGIESGNLGAMLQALALIEPGAAAVQESALVEAIEPAVVSEAMVIRAQTARVNGQKSAEVIAVEFGAMPADQMIRLPAYLFYKHTQLPAETPNRSALIAALDAAIVEAGSLALISDEIALPMMVKFDLNVDPRDIGFLADPANRLKWDEWKTIETAKADRFSVKLGVTTVSFIAALNSRLIESDKGKFLCWLPAYAVAMGMFPAEECFTAKVGPNGRGLAREYIMTYTPPTTADVDIVNDAYEKSSRIILSLTVNLVAVFGIQHLHNDHTYRPNDANMTRVNGSMFNALLTISKLYEEDMEQIRQHAAFTMRGAFHFLGLGGPYAVFRHAVAHQTATQALRVRELVGPPPVQKSEIALAGISALSSLPAAKGVQEAYRAQLAMASKLSDAVKKSPPAYSDLYYLYGEPEQLRHNAVESQMVADILPIVAGYANVFCQETDEEGLTRRTGLALSRALANVARDKNAEVVMYTGIFQALLDAVQSSELNHALSLIASAAKKTPES